MPHANRVNATQTQSAFGVHDTERVSLGESRLKFRPAFIWGTSAFCVQCARGFANMMGAIGARVFHTQHKMYLKQVKPLGSKKMI